MSVEGYAEFLCRIGHNVRRSGNHYWFNSQDGVYQPFPLDVLVDPHEIDLKAILGWDGLIARYPCSLSLGRRSFAQICHPADYGLHRLSSKARNQTRRGLERCEVHPLDPQMLRTHGLDINADTMNRQGRRLSAARAEYWRKYFHEVTSAQGAEVWGAFVDGNLAAFLVAFQMRSCVHIFIMRSARRFLSVYPNNALLFTFINKLAGDPSVAEVSIGIEPIQAELDSLSHFKYGMGFQSSPIGQRIEVAWWLRPILNSGVGQAICLMAKYKGAASGEKVARVIDWYRTQPSLSVIDELSGLESEKSESL